jgi:hypothetical protein
MLILIIICTVILVAYIGFKTEKNIKKDQNQPKSELQHQSIQSEIEKDQACTSNMLDMLINIKTELDPFIKNRDDAYEFVLGQLEFANEERYKTPILSIGSFIDECGIASTKFNGHFEPAYKSENNIGCAHFIMQKFTNIVKEDPSFYKLCRESIIQKMMVDYRIGSYKQYMKGENK